MKCKNTGGECNGSISGSPRPYDRMVLRPAGLVPPRGTSSATKLQWAVFSQALRNYRYSSRALNSSGMYMMFSRPWLQSLEKPSLIHI